MVRIETNPKTFRREEFEMDQRDYKLENTIGTPTEQDLKDLPKSVMLNISKTYNQGALGSCTAHALTHVQLYQNEEEFKTELEMDPISLWIRMGHDPNNPADSGDYLENALKFCKSKGIDGKLPDGKSYTYLADGYAYRSFGALIEKDFSVMKYYLNQKMPLYTSMRGTSRTWREMIAGEVVTVYTAGEATGGHAISVFGIDDEYVYFVNSRAPVNGEKISKFKVKRTTMIEMIKRGMLGWRYWIVYDKKDITTEPLFDDYYKEEHTEEYKAVKRCKDNGIINGHNNKLMPNEPLTREHMALIMYRFNNLMNGKQEKKVEKKAEPKKKSGWEELE